jgi:RHS repeat-associated protein
VDRAGLVTIGTVQVFIDTTPPAVPTDLEAIPGPTAITVSWQPNAEWDFAYYVLRRTPAFSDGPQERIIPKDSGATYTDVDVAIGVTCTYEVRAVDHIDNASAFAPAVTVKAGVTETPVDTATGGTVKYEDIKVEIPPQALETDGIVTIIALKPENAPAIVDNVVVGNILNLDVVQNSGEIANPEPEAFLQPVTMTFTYREEDIPAGMTEANLFVYRYDPGTQSWIRVPGQVIDMEKNTITIPVERFSSYSIQASTALPPDPQTLNGLGVAPYQAYFQENNESVSPSSGNLSIRVVDLRLPGRNGLDLEISRSYDMLGHQVATLDAKSARPFVSFGGGWTLDLPWIGKNDNGSFLTLPGGGTYEIKWKMNGSGWDRQGHGVYTHHEGEHFTIEQFQKFIRDIREDVGEDRTQYVKVGEEWAPARYVAYLKDGRRFEFDGSGKLTAITDRTGQNTIRYNYYGSRLTSIEDSLGRVVTFAYSDGRIVSIRSGDREVKYAYNPHLSAVTDPEGRVTAYSYTSMAAGQVYNSSTDSYEKKTYTALLEKITYPSGGYATYGYQGKDDGFANDITRAVVGSKAQYPAQSSQQVYNQTSFAYSWKDKTKITAATITAPARITEMTFDDKSLATRKVTKDRTQGDILGERVDYEYNTSLKAVTKESYIKSGINPENGQYRIGPAYVKTYAYDDWGNVTYEHNSATGLETRYAYANTNSAQSFPAPFAPAPFTSSVPAKVHDLVTGQTRLNHDPVRGVTVPVQSHYQYDGVGNLVKEAKRHDGAWLVTSYEYDQYGNATRKTDPLGRVTRYEYDGTYKNAYPTRVTVEGLKDADDLPLSNVVTEYGYHFDTGLKAWEKDGRGYVTSYEYDKLNRLRKTVFPGPNNPVKLTDFDDANNTYTVTDENQNRTTFFYDGLAHLVQVAQYKRSGGAYSPYATTSFTYDASGNVATMTDANGNVTSYAYDGLGRLVKTTHPDETPVSAGDNPVSQVLFDDYANTVTTVDANGHKTVQIKDWADRVTQIAQHNTYTGEVLTTSVAYDRLTNKVRVVDPRGDTTRQVFDDLGRVVEVIYPAMAVTKPSATGETTDTPRVTYTYDAVGNKLTETSANGHASGQAAKYTTNYKYDALNRLIKTVEPFTALDGAAKQRVTRTYYDAVGNKVKVVDGNGHAVTFEYDARKRLIKQTDARGYSTTHEYDPAGNRIRTTDPRGFSTWYIFDELNRLARGILPDQTPPANPYVSPEDNPYVEFAYDLVGNKLTERDPNGNISTFAYTPRYWLKSVTDPAGATTTFGYDKVGNQTSVTDPNGNTTTNVYDDLNRLVKTVNPFGQAATFAYDRAGNRTKQVDTNGHVTEWTYNPLKKLTQVKDAKGGVTRYQYDPNGNLVAMIDAKGQTTCYTYNELNWLTRETNSLGLVSTYAYDLAGNRSHATSPRGVQTTYQYYPNNLLKEVSYTLASQQEQISYEYDPAGNRTRMVDPSGEAAYAYDPLNQITSLSKSILGRSYSSDYRYDKAGNITGIRYPNATAWLEYQYSNINRVYAIPGFADGSQYNPAFTYDGAGNLKSVRLNSGVTSTYIPDKMNRLQSISVTSPKQPTPVLSLNYTYDGEGNILTRNDNVYRYDELDRLIYSQIRGVFSDDIPARKGYVTGDFLGEKAPNYGTSEDTAVSFDYAASSVGLDFGGTAQVRRLYLAKDNPAAGAARVKPSTLDLYASTDGTTFTRLDPTTYQLQNTLDGMIFEFSTPQSTGQLKVHSKFDDRNEDGAFADKATFRNALGEMVRVEQEVSQATLEYGYDAVGNRTYERFTKVSVHSKDYVYYANSNRLLTDGRYAFVYDDDGNLIRKGNRFTISGETVSFTTEGEGVEYWEYGYNLRNQLTQVKKNGQLVATYAYDGLGLRVSATTTITSKTTGQAKTTTRDYLFDLADRVIYDRVISTAGSLPSAEDPETSTENSYVFANGAHFAKVEGPIGTTAEVYYYHNDHLGSPMAITDSQGNLAWSQDYLPYGEALNESAAQTKTRFTFTGKELDPATGLMYYNARWYDPDLGRFMTEDTYAGYSDNPATLNRYTYVLGNPVKWIDPSGHDSTEIYRTEGSAYGSVTTKELDALDKVYKEVLDKTDRANALRQMADVDVRVRVFKDFDYKMTFDSSGQPKFTPVGKYGNPPTGPGLQIRPGGNPSLSDVVAKVISESWRRNIPLTLGLAAAWTESRMKQFNSNGTPMAGANYSLTGELLSTDWGLMQINDYWQVRRARRFALERLQQEWGYNVEAGIQLLSEEYAAVLRRNQPEPEPLRATYSRYSGGPGETARYRENPIDQDRNFWRNYTEEPWRQ